MQLAFIIPRYGPNILGGAESLARGFAERLTQQGWRIEVWTTCAHDYHTWQNVYPAGTETINDEVLLYFEYNTDLFKKTTILIMVERFKILLKEIIKNPGGIIENLNIKLEEEVELDKNITNAQVSKN